MALDIFTIGALAAAGIGLIIALILFFKRRLGKTGLPGFFNEKRRLLEEIRIAEQNYLKRKISQQDFEKIMQAKQARLIEIDARIDQEHRRKEPEKPEELEKITAKNKHLLKDLLDEKARLIKEADIAEIKYRKRQISEQTYAELTSQNRQKIIEIEAKIRNLYSEENIEKTMQELREKLRELELSREQRERNEKKKMIEDISEGLED